MSHAINVNFLSTLLPEMSLLETAQISIIPILVTSVPAPDSLPGAAGRPRGLVPCGNPPLPITANRLPQDLPHHFHIALFQLSTAVQPCVHSVSFSFFFTLFTLLFSVLPSSSPPHPYLLLPTTMPTSHLFLEGAGAVLVLLLCLPRTDVQEIPVQ